jgi:dephospho-CoA kinase
MLRVAVTGNIGSGKTSVCRVFESLGVPVFYADQEAKLFYRDPAVLNTLSIRFGNAIITPGGSLDKSALAEIIFNDESAMEFIRQLIHPRVYEKYKQWLQAHKYYPYTIQESALVFESGSYKKFDHIILVHAPEEMLISRVMNRDKVSYDQVMQRLAHQIPQQEKRSLSHFLLLNDNTSLIIPRILDIHSVLTSTTHHS